jgi:predicted phosphoribosyltransferase
MVMFERAKYYKDRDDAGRQLAEKLVQYQSDQVVVLAIPRGGVPVAVEVALMLKAPLDTVVTRKIPIPYEPEAGYGAVAEDGSVFLNKPMVDRLGLSQRQIGYQVEEVLAEIKRRSAVYREILPRHALVDKTVILIDDGLASGFTMVAAIKSVRQWKASKVVVASPVASGSAYNLVKPMCDALICLIVSCSHPFAVASFYRYWHDLTDKEITNHVRDWQSRREEKEKGG